MNERLEDRLHALGQAALRSVDAVTATEVIGRRGTRERGRPPRRGITALSTFVAAGCFAAGTGVAAAVNHLSSRDVERGLPGAARLFDGTNPTCEAVDEGVYICELAYPPVAEQTAYADQPQAFLDKEHRVRGACIPVSSDLMHWLCAADNLAVDYGYIDPDLLGEVQSTPGVG